MGMGLAGLHYGVRTSTLEIIAVSIEGVIVRLTRGPADSLGCRNGNAHG